MQVCPISLVPAPAVHRLHLAKCNRSDICSCNCVLKPNTGPQGVCRSFVPEEVVLASPLQKLLRKLPPGACLQLGPRLGPASRVQAQMALQQRPCMVQHQAHAA